MLIGRLYPESCFSEISTPTSGALTCAGKGLGIRHFSLLNVNAAGACGYDFLCDGGRLVRAYVRLRRGAI